MAQVIFNYNQNNINIQCDTHSLMKDICEKFSFKINKKIDRLIFLYNGKKIQQSLLFEQQIDLQDKKYNTINIVVYDVEKTIINDKFVKSNEIICPQCKESALVNITNFKFNLSGCKNSHNFNFLTLPNFEKSQNYNLSKIICNKCLQNNKGNTYNNQFYKCISCGMNLCPICKCSHDVNHKIINYDKKNYICNQHNENYIKYCYICKANLCIKCEVNHKEHNSINFGEILPNEGEIVEQITNLKKTIDKFNDNIKRIMRRLCY